MFIDGLFGVIEGEEAWSLAVSIEIDLMISHS